MKLLFDRCNLQSYFDDSNVRLGMGWYRHSKDHKWWGITVEFYLLYWMITATFVNDFDAYDRKINYRKYKK